MRLCRIRVHGLVLIAQRRFTPEKLDLIEGVALTFLPFLLYHVLKGDLFQRPGERIAQFSPYIPGHTLLRTRADVWLFYTLGVVDASLQGTENVAQADL